VWCGSRAEAFIDASHNQRVRSFDREQRTTVKMSFRRAAAPGNVTAENEKGDTINVSPCVLTSPEAVK
jgi:hypothetical protein